MVKNGKEIGIIIDLAETRTQISKQQPRYHDWPHLDLFKLLQNGAIYYWKMRQFVFAESHPAIACSE